MLIREKESAPTVQGRRASVKKDASILPLSRTAREAIIAIAMVAACYGALVIAAVIIKIGGLA